MSRSACQYYLFIPRIVPGPVLRQPRPADHFPARARLTASTCFAHRSAIFSRFIRLIVVRISSPIGSIQRAPTASGPVMTASAFSEDVIKAKSEGMDGHIAKPIDIPQMMQTLTEIVNKQQS